MTQKTTIVLPDDTHHRVRRAAAQQHKSMGAFIREAIEEKLQSEQPRPKSIGIFASGHTDTAEKAGDWKFEPRTWRS